MTSVLSNNKLSIPALTISTTREDVYLYTDFYILPVGWNSIDFPQNLVFIRASWQNTKLRLSA